jgi:hypothetical protein
MPNFAEQARNLGTARLYATLHKRIFWKVRLREVKVSDRRRGNCSGATEPGTSLR